MERDKAAEQAASILVIIFTQAPVDQDEENAAGSPGFWSRFPMQSLWRCLSGRFPHRIPKEKCLWNLLSRCRWGIVKEEDSQQFLEALGSVPGCCLGRQGNGTFAGGCQSSPCPTSCAPAPSCS